MSFQLKQKKDRQAIQIYYIYYYLGKRTSFFSGETISHIQLWSKTKNLVDITKAKHIEELMPLVQRIEINTRLGHFHTTVNQLVTKLLTEGNEPSCEAIKERLTKAKAKSKKETELHEFNVLDAFDEFIAYNQNVLDRKENTIKSYTTTKNHLYLFQAYRKQKLRFNQFNDDLINRFSKFMQSSYVQHTRIIKGKIVISTTKTKIIGINDSALSKELKVIKTFLLWSNKQGYFADKEFTKNIKVKDGIADIVVLSADQLKHLAHLDVPKRLQLTRDIYVIGSFTGLRISDILDINKQQIHIDPTNLINSYVERLTIKTNTLVRIPLTKEVAQIFIKYQCTLPSISQPTFNRKIKLIGALANLNAETQKTTLKKSMHQHTTKPFFEYMSSHQMRRNFISMLVRKGVTAEKIMDLTGHVDYKSFKKYIKINNEDRQQTISVLEGILSDSKPL